MKTLLLFTIISIFSFSSDYSKFFLENDFDFIQKEILIAADLEAHNIEKFKECILSIDPEIDGAEIDFRNCFELKKQFVSTFISVMSEDKN